MISQRSIQEVLSIAQVTEIVDEYVTLKRRGSNFIGLCPFHDEKTPSFSVSPSKNIYKCFGCGKGGGPVQFIMEQDSLSFPEAIRRLAARYNIEIEQDSQEDQEKYQEQKKLEDSYYIINDFAVEYFMDSLQNSLEGKTIGLSYFKERGFLDSTIEKFQLGYAPKGSKSFLTAATNKQFKEDYLKDIGLISSRGYDFFSDRVIFPIHGVSGKAIAFAGRTLSKDKKTPKYINSPETPIYNKSKVLYGINLAKSAIRKEDSCLIAEGYTDVISLHQSGIENVVASSGTSLTAEQVRVVKRYTDNIVFLYDGDPAGVKAALRGLDIVLENDMNVKLVLLPEGEDPDSLVKNLGYKETMAFIAESAKDFIFFKLDLLREEAGEDPVKISELVQNMISSIARVRDPIKRSLYSRQCSQTMNVQEGILIKEVNKQIRKEIKQKDIERNRKKLREAHASSDAPFPTEIPPGYHELDEYPEEQVSHTQPTITVNAHEYQEKDLARIIILSGDRIIKTDEEGEISVAELIYSNINDVIDYFKNPLYKELIELGFRQTESGDDSLSFHDFFVNHERAEIRAIAIEMLSSPYQFAKWNDIGVFLNQMMPEDNFYHDSKQAIMHFKLRKVAFVLNELKVKILDKSLDDDKKSMWLKAFHKLQQQKKELSEELGVVIPPS